jgi:hypothetical protein
MHVRKKWLPYVIAALVFLALAQIAVSGAGVAGWFEH